MKYSLIVLAPPNTHQSSQSAYRFARAALRKGHTIHRVFFYSDGVHNGSQLSVLPQGENNLQQQWQTLSAEHNVDLVVCIATALRRGVLNQEEADRFEKAAANLQEPDFDLSGLGQLIDATEQSDRVITFGG